MMAMIDYRSPAGRYRDDPKFRAVVDLLEAYIHAAHFTPHEIREAAGLAAFHACLRSPFGARLNFTEAIISDAPPVGPPPVVLVDGLPYRLDTEGHEDSHRAVDALHALEAAVYEMARSGGE